MQFSKQPLVLAAIVASGICVTPQLASSQDGPASGMSAREIYYLADEAPPAPTVKPKTPAQPPLQRKSTHTKPAAPIAEARENDPNDAQPGSVHLATVSDRKYPPLGMRYAVYRLAGGSKEPIDADTVFHSNDHIQFTVEVNTPAYLYVIARGSSGKWSTLFPSADSEANANLIQPHAGYTYPPGQMITFTDPAGKEEMFLFLSRQPVRSTEDLMLQISGNGKSAPVEKQNQQLPHSNVVEAFNRMDDTQIQSLRAAYSRDLIVEKVNTDSGVSAPPVAQAPAKDTSVYVVNPAGGADAHVVADITFRHE